MFRTLCAAALLMQACLFAQTPSDVLAKLMEGNSHFVSGQLQNIPNISQAKNRLLESQVPMAVILACADSRVPPELIFDRSLGELFVVRVAGNIAGPLETASVEYGVDKLKASLVMVLGHENCGAVQAAISKGRDHLVELEPLYPYIDKALKGCPKPDVLHNAIECNVRYNMEMLKKSPMIAPQVKEGQVKVVGAYFNFDTGKVTVLPD